MTEQTITTDEAGEPKEGIAKLREAFNENPALKATISDKDRTIAFLKAGIDPDENELASMFAQGYKGDLNPDAIRAKAVELGIMRQQGTGLTPEQQAAAAADQRTQRVASAGGNPNPSNPVQGVKDAFRERGREGMVEFAQQYGVPYVEP